jgi:hypothetical protein
VSPTRPTGRSKLDEQLRALAERDGIAISLNEAFSSLKEVHLADQALEVIAGYACTADVAITAIKLPGKP